VGRPLGYKRVSLLLRPKKALYILLLGANGTQGILNRNHFERKERIERIERKGRKDTVKRKEEDTSHT
jgi:hypothetical protein